MSENVHNFRWRYRSGRVSWTYPTRDEADASAVNIPEELVLEESHDNGQTWKEVKS